MSYYDHPALSRSDLKDILTSPNFFYGKKILGLIDQKESYAMDFGTKAHMALLEPDKLKREYLILEELCLPAKDYEKVKGRCKWVETKRTKTQVWFEVGKSDGARDTLIKRISEHYGTKKIILPDEWQQIDNQVKALVANEQTKQILTGDEVYTEVDMFGELKGVDVKCRLDILLLLRGQVEFEYQRFGSAESVSIRPDALVVDYKTTDKAINPKNYAYEMSKLSSDMQAYMYPEIVKQHADTLRINPEKVYFALALQNKKSFQNIVLFPGAGILTEGERKVNLALEIYNRCMATNQWDDYLDPYSGNTNTTAMFEVEHIGG